MKKNVIGVSASTAAQATGAGWDRIPFFGYQGMGRQANPCIGASYVPPVTLEPGVAGVADVQPQRGFETVTLMFQGQLQTRDSAGHAATLEAGDVLWNCAGRGLLRQDQGGPRLAAEGGTLELATLWVNLPADYKMTDPHQQHLAAASIPVVELGDGVGELRVIAGEYEGVVGPAETVTPLQLWDIRLQAGEQETLLKLPSHWYGVLLVLEGAVHVNYWQQPVTAQHLVFLGTPGQEVGLRAEQDTRLLLISGEPLDETIAGSGELVLNTPEQVEQSLQDLAAGQFGTL